MNCSLGTCESLVDWVCRRVNQTGTVSESVNESLDQEVDVELLQRMARGDKEAFAAFYDRYAALLFSIIFRILNDQKESEDVLQEASLLIWEKATVYTPSIGKPSSWAVTIARNKAIDRIRFLQRQNRLVEKAATEGEGNEPVRSVRESVYGREKAELIRVAITDLPVDQRQAIEMAFFKGLTQYEISETLREPLGTVKARIRRGMLKLRASLEGLL